MECEQCGKEFEAEDLHPLKTLEGVVAYEHLCEDCRDMLESEADVDATCVYSDDPNEPRYITDYRDDTDGDFKPKWVSTDGWRGHFDVVPSPKWRLVQSDCSLWGSYDSTQLQEFDEKFRDLLDNKGIQWVRVITRTSNVFSAGYDFFVEAEHYDLAMTWKSFLALKYRDPVRFEKTALTGADPVEWTDTDDQFFEAYKLVQGGMDPKEAVEKVMGGE